MKQRQKMVYSIVFLISTGMVFFQNCSQNQYGLTANNGMANNSLTQDLPVLETSPYESSYVPDIQPPNKIIEDSRTLNVFLNKTNVEVTSNNLKILLVIDNSATMTNSQENLSRNINILLSSLKGKNAQVMIIPTDAYVKDSALNTTISAVDTNTQTTYESGVQRGLTKTGKARPIISFNNSDTIDQYSANISAVSNAIKNLGVSGADREAPIASLALNLNYQNFFLKNDTALIYFITDENDITSFSTHFFTDKQFSKKERQTFESKSIYCINCYRFEYKYLSTAADGTKTFDQSNMQLFPNLTECLKSEKEIKDQGFTVTNTCKFYNKFTSNSGVNLMVNNIGCDDYIAQYPSTLKSEINCISNTETTDVTVTAASYNLYNLTNSNKNINVTLNSNEILSIPDLKFQIFSNLKSQLDTLFNGKYVIGASVNTESQNCILKTGQSKDQSFALMQKFFPKEKFLIDSICDSTKFTSSLDQISKKFEEITKTDGYMLEMNPDKEIIKEVHLVFKDGHKITLEKTQFSINKNILSFYDIDLSQSDIEKAEVQISNINN